MDLFRTRLTSVNETGLNIPKLPHDYVLRYHGALIGKHFKGLVQIMAFIVNGLVREKLNLGWNLLGRLAVLIWESDIVDLDCHCVSNSNANCSRLMYAKFTIEYDLNYRKLYERRSKS